MTTPADWKMLIPNLRDIESVRFAKRLVQFQREWLDIQAAQLEEIERELEELERKRGQSDGFTSMET